MGHLRHWRRGGFILPIMFGTLTDVTGIRSSAFMLLYGMVWVSVLRIYRIEMRGAKGMGSKVKAFRLHGQRPQFNQGKP
jgi:nitrate/nitrite transporter NarK